MAGRQTEWSDVDATGVAAELNYGLRHLVSGEYLVGDDIRFGPPADALRMTRIDAERLRRQLRAGGVLVAAVTLPVQSDR